MYEGAKEGEDKKYLKPRYTFNTEIQTVTTKEELIEMTKLTEKQNQIIKLILTAINLQID